MKTAIIGGGIGGIGAAIALRLRGIDVDVYEQAPRFEEVGAGVQISPNGFKVLQALGVGEAILKKAYEPEQIEMRYGSNGQVIAQVPIKEVAKTRWGSPYLHIRRSTLHDALVKRSKDLGVVTKLGERIEPDNITDLKADVIIGADGFHSSIRNCYFNTPSVRFSGKTAWRAVVPSHALELLPPRGATVWVGRNIHAVTTWIDGGKSVNFVGVSEGNWSDADWNNVAGIGEAEALFNDFDRRVCEIISKADVVRKWALFEHDPLDRLVHENIALIGDAAHPMMPSLAQGAVVALEDAWVLAKCIYDDPAHGLAKYSAQRLPRVTRAQSESQKNLERFQRNGVFSWCEQTGAKMLNRFYPNYFINRLDWLYGEDVTRA